MAVINGVLISKRKYTRVICEPELRKLAATRDEKRDNFAVSMLTAVDRIGGAKAMNGWARAIQDGLTTPDAEGDEDKGDSQGENLEEQGD